MTPFITAFKKVDFYIQFIVGIITIGFGIFAFNELPFFAYFVVGGVQLVSAIIHAATDRNRIKTRRNYEKAVLVLFGITAAVAGITYVAPDFGGFLLLIAFGWLFITPFYAIWYVIVTYKELGKTDEVIIHEPLDQIPI